jgi:rhodanese-related sulfurtransferase
MKDINVTELKAKRDAGEDFVLIDVRETYEWDEFNIGGTLIPLGTLPGKLPDLEMYKDKEIVIYCRSGNRSGNAKMYLEQNGFTKVRNLLGGMLDWRDTFGQ